ncbi:MAG: metal-dependent hydrolase [Nanoarchaeota archaeon]|nr:metal-dependent hydrolase [Nanoarchaeota archaeon]
MLFGTHLAFGFLISLYLIDFFDIKNQILFIIVLIFFSIFPDIDRSTSKVYKKLKPFSYFAIIFGHRNIFHTIYLPLLISTIFFIFDQKLISMAVFIGYSLHLLLDSLTKNGIKWFYPLIQKRVAGPLKTGSFIESGIFAALIILIVLKLV